MQILRVKCWRALRTFDPARSSMPVERYVFSCVKNQIKDLLKKRKRSEVYVEDAQRSRTSYGKDTGIGWEGDGNEFVGRYMSTTFEATFEDDGELELPVSVTIEEREVCVLLVEGYKAVEISEVLSIRPARVKELIDSVRPKLAPMLKAA